VRACVACACECVATQQVAARGLGNPNKWLSMRVGVRMGEAAEQA